MSTQTEAQIRLQFRCEREKRVRVQRGVRLLRIDAVQASDLHRVPRAAVRVAHALQRHASRRRPPVVFACPMRRTPIDTITLPVYAMHQMRVRVLLMHLVSCCFIFSSEQLIEETAAVMAGARTGDRTAREQENRRNDVVACWSKSTTSRPERGSTCVTSRGIRLR